MNIKSLLRPVVFRFRYSGSVLASQFFPATASTEHPAFVIGCGRSGTTVLGKILRQHPSIAYYFEPYHYWAAMDRRNDVGQLYTQHPESQLIRSESSSPAIEQKRFARLFRPGQSKQMIEKTPHNAMRIGYIESFTRRAKYLHIYRDGADVVASITKISEGDQYRIAGRPSWNAWWGENRCKWDVLAKDGIQRGYLAEVVPQLRTEQEMAAYEWLVSLWEIERNREALGDRLMEFGYADLVANPRKVLAKICEHINVPSDAALMDYAESELTDLGDRKVPAPVLHPELCKAFNTLQEKLGFHNFAVPAVPEATASQG